MTNQINAPYVKQFDSNGTLLNPIKGSLVSNFPNRKQRRQIKQKNRFYGESKNFHLTCDGEYAFLRHKQLENDKEGNKKTILHYIVR